MSDSLHLRGRINLAKAAVLLLAGPTGMNPLRQMFDGFGVKHPYRCDTHERAMQLCRETDMDLIICDGDLADGQAYDFITALRRSDLEPNRFAPIIVVAGHTPLNLVTKARDCGASFLLTKPVTPRVLMERVIWVAREARPFIELDSYAGPDRRFKTIGPPDKVKRRRGDRTLAPITQGMRVEAEETVT
jgi:DNA-binding response OmpR family regulator